jgi:hypothetical protein
LLRLRFLRLMKLSVVTVSQLPKARQRFVSEMLDAVLAQAQQ